MASILYEVKCPCCEWSVFEDYYYKTGERYIICSRCGLDYKKLLYHTDEKGFEYREEINGGHGVFVLMKKDGIRVSTRLNGRITDEELEEYKSRFMKDEVNQQESYLVSFEEGVFTIILGTPPEGFFLMCEEGKTDNEFVLPLENRYNKRI
ncbi:hypothetical protein M3649_13875 [Ureibacillus chungkukjangi]|uniref:hypothetical protein n=1 Tax=Ureibacillus chungkukjangi TaxID=1202712 RepID=UPI002040C306|nr:hypothetical protein [Ureibacillus chungkukjangi]MCM3389224.1 hypothetical protein [Ureibacillus chungkukjangi]